MISSLPLFGTSKPKEGDRYIPLVFPFAALAPLTTLTQNINVADAGVSQIAGILIDNSLNARSVFIKVQDTGQIIACRPMGQVQTRLLTGGLNVTLIATSSGGIDVPVKLLNYVPDEIDQLVYNPLINKYIAPTAPVETLLPASFVGPFANNWTQIAPPNPLRYGYVVTYDNGAASGTLCMVAWGDINGLTTGFFVGGAWVNKFVTLFGPGDWYNDISVNPDIPIPNTAVFATQGDTVPRNISFREQTF